MPTYSNHTYNYISFSYFLSTAVTDTALIWTNPTTYMGTDSIFGRTNIEIQTNLKKLYNNNGVKILVTAFGNV